MLQHLIDDNNLWPQFESSKLTPTDLIFIKELIAGPLKPSIRLRQGSSSRHWAYEGRSIDKSFLYEVWTVLIINLSLVLYNRLLLIKEME